jgi:hypothetical protein
LHRERVKRALARNPRLAARLGASMKSHRGTGRVWDPELDRIRRLVLKLARGHVACELNRPQLVGPDRVVFQPLLAMSETERREFEGGPWGELQPWPDVGSRAFLRASQGGGRWVEVQEGRYRYSVEETGGVLVQIVLSEYLECIVEWE